MNDSFAGKIKKIRSRGPLAGKAYELIKEAIVQGRFAPGTWLLEEHLTRAMGISRTPIREAFNRLKSEGLIDVIPRKGARIVELTATEIDDLFEARQVIETTFFVRSAERISREQVEKFRETLSKQETGLRQCEDDTDAWNASRQQYLQTDRALHDALIAAAGNKYWEQLYYNLRDRIEIYGNRVSFDREWFAVAMVDHHRIIDAILTGDLEGGKDAMSQHIRNVRKGIDRIMAAHLA